MNKQGWQCPVCGRVNAPFITQCPCSLGTTPNRPWDPYFPPNYPRPFRYNVWISDKRTTEGTL